MITQKIRQFVDRVLGQSSKPRIYTQNQHGIRRAHVSRNAIKVCEVLQQQGYEAYIVGGAVRDLILGLEPKDFDVATSAKPDQVRRLFKRAFIIGRRFKLVHVTLGREIIETSTFRAMTDHVQMDEHGRIISDNVFGTLEEDALRRDFTVNALYYDPIKQEVIDFHNGLYDLHSKTIRIIGDARIRYREDPVRMLRSVRFAAKLNGHIHSETLVPIRELAPLIKNVPSSRLFDESYKLFICGNAHNCLRQLQELGLQEATIPLLDKVLSLNGADDFIRLVLDRTDSRVRLGKSVSLSFLYAALLWPLVLHYWKRYQLSGESNIIALSLACDDVLSEQRGCAVLQKRHSSDIREIWMMQPRFEVAKVRQIWRMSEQPRFRAAVDFMQMRAANHQVNSVLAQWWMDFADADAASRTVLLEHYGRLVSQSELGKSKPKRRRSRSRAGRRERVI